MKLRLPATASLLALAAVKAVAADWAYPPPITSDAADVFHGRRYQDPYRPLEASVRAPRPSGSRSGRPALARGRPRSGRQAVATVALALDGLLPRAVASVPTRSSHAASSRAMAASLARISTIRGEKRAWSNGISS